MPTGHLPLLLRAGSPWCGVRHAFIRYLRNPTEPPKRPPAGQAAVPIGAGPSAQRLRDLGSYARCSKAQCTQAKLSAFAAAVRSGGR